jgi:hypothetical protein
MLLRNVRRKGSEDRFPMGFVATEISEQRAREQRPRELFAKAVRPQLTALAVRLTLTYTGHRALATVKPGSGKAIKHRA